MNTEEIYGLTFGTLVLVLLTIVTVVVIWQGLATWRTRYLVMREDAYRKLAEQGNEASSKVLKWQERIAEDLSDIRQRVNRIEALLAETE